MISSAAMDQHDDAPRARRSQLAMFDDVGLVVWCVEFLRVPAAVARNLLGCSVRNTHAPMASCRTSTVRPSSPLEPDRVGRVGAWHRHRATDTAATGGRGWGLTDQ